MSFLPVFRQTKAAGFGLAAAVALTLVWSCSSTEPGPPPPNTTPSSVVPAAGTDNQTAVAGTAVAIAPSVTVTNSDGAALSGTSVTFAVATGGGSVTGGAATTDAQGVATVTSWTLGNTAGTNTLTATAGNVVFTFTAIGQFGPPVSVTVEAGDGQTATTGTPVAVAPAAKLVDANNNPVTGTSVTWTVTAGNGSVTGAATPTDANGIATLTSWTLGDVGNNALEASVAGVAAPAVFTAFSIGIPATITLSAGDNQTTSAGSPVPTDPTVEVRDAGGNTLEMITVTFTVTQGGGSVSAATTTTDASGIAGITWTLGTVAGANVMDASVAGVASPVTFNATGVAGPPTMINITAGDNQSATVGTALANPLQATLQDQFGNGVSSVSLTFFPLGGSSVDNTNVTTDASGNASVTWTMATTAGAVTMDVSASGGGITPAVANATANPDVATAMTVSAGDNQSAVQGGTVATAPAVLVADQFANPVPGVSVTFTPSGDGSVTGSPATTDASGIATVGSWTLTSAAGANTLDATATGTNTATFNATATIQVGSIQRDAGDGQVATVNTAVANPVRVLVLDTGGNPAPGIPVTFAVTLGGGSITGATQVTDASGLATLGSWTLGTAATANEVQCSVDSDPTNLFVLFGATATADAATSMTISAGDNQSTGVGTAVPLAPAVLITDAFTNPIQGASVTFTPSGDGQVTGSPATTDVSGIATVGSWTLATAPGGNTLDASSSGVSNVTFNATGTQQLFNIAILQGNDLTGPTTGPLPTNPTVRVTDQGTGLPVSGVSVSFTPRSGEGSVNSPTVVTDANGDAAVQWTPGRNGSNFMDVVASNASTQFFSIGSNANYNIELRFLSLASMAQKQAFGNAAGDWMLAIGGDLAPIDFSGSPIANSCGGFFGEPVLNTLVDDLLIWVVFAPIDGQGGVLAQAGACLTRTSGSLPVVGGMQFDTADLPPSSGSLEDITLHEMGHVIGFGAGIWNAVNPNLFQNPSCVIVAGVCNPDIPGADTHFTGANANTQWTTVGGAGWMPPTSATTPVPLENTQGGPGTRDSHWRESTFVNELMTGFVTSGPTGSNLFSVVTMGLFQDLGYTSINYGSADAYSLATDGNPSGLRAGPTVTIELKDDIIDIPIGMVDPAGRVVRYIAR